MIGPILIMVYIRVSHAEFDFMQALPGEVRTLHGGSWDATKGLMAAI